MDIPYGKVAKYLAIGLEIPSTILGAVFVGYLVDSHFGTGPWFTVVCSILGFIGAVFRLVKYLKYFSTDAGES
ncbi:MAG TPA: AtpZ/AtpI family protein [Candidatus Binatia bacterium]|jgi:F0F1-type ATP synthase assembly protein I